MSLEEPRLGINGDAADNHAEPPRASLGQVFDAIDHAKHWSRERGIVRQFTLFARFTRPGYFRIPDADLVGQLILREEAEVGGSLVHLAPMARDEQVVML